MAVVNYVFVINLDLQSEVVAKIKFEFCNRLQKIKLETMYVAYHRLPYKLMGRMDSLAADVSTGSCYSFPPVSPHPTKNFTLIYMHICVANFTQEN